MARKYGIGTKVEWKWGNGKATGKVEEVFTEKVTRTIKGKVITRDASEDEPAYLLSKEDGDRVVKSHSELGKA